MRGIGTIMGLFDAFGVGGGSLAVQLQFPQAQAGSVVHGVATFTGGKRAQQITNVTVRLTVTQQVMQNGQLMQQTRDLVPALTLAGAFTAQPGQAYQFPFQFQLPHDAYGSAPNQVGYRVVGNADIDGEIDPGAGVELHVVGAAAPMQGMMPMGGPQYAPQPAKTGYESKGGGFDAKGAYGAPAKGGFEAQSKGGGWDAKGGHDAKGGGWDAKGGGHDAHGKGAPAGKGGGFAPGTSVLAQWTDGAHYRATVASVQGDQVLVQWDGGAPDSWVHVSQIRTH